MTAAVNQDFTFYAGDSAVPVFTVTNGPSGPAIDISSASQITFGMARSYSDVVPILTKTKTGGGITFVSTGVDGKFKVTLLGIDTAALAGSYVYSAKVTDQSNNVTTVAIGSIQIGTAVSWTYDATMLAGTDAYSLRMKVRTLIGDINTSDQQLWDQTIAFALTEQGNNIYLAGWACCLMLAAKYSRDIDTTQGDLHRLYSARQKAYKDRALELQTIGRSRSAGVGFSGADSYAAKYLQNQNTDRVVPQFMIGLTDNWLPIPPVDNQLGGPQGGDGWTH